MKMKVSLKVRTCLIGAWSSIALFTASGAVVTNFSADFDTYTLGTVAGQSGTGAVGSGGWVVPATSVGTVSVSPDPNPQVGSRALGIYRPEGTSGITAPLATNLALNSAGLVYFAFDLYKPEDTAGGTFQLQSTTRSFGIYFDSTVNSSLKVNETRDSQIDSEFTIATDIWYRLEFEITKSGTGNTGLFSLFVSSTNLERQLILENISYSFQNGTQTTILANANSVGFNRQFFVDNIVLQSGLTEFPVNPIIPVPEISPWHAMLLSLCFAMVLRPLRRLLSAD